MTTTGNLLTGDRHAVVNISLTETSRAAAKRCHEEDILAYKSTSSELAALQCHAKMDKLQRCWQSNYPSMWTRKNVAMMTGYLPPGGRIIK